jgi:two-component system response regulator HydG
MDRLMLHSWPGNIRELENVLERSMGFCVRDLLTAEDVRFTTLSTTADSELTDGLANNLAGMTLEDVEKKAIVETLTFVGGNKAKAARVLGISEKSIYNKMRRLGVDHNAGR